MLIYETNNQYFLPEDIEFYNHLVSGNYDNVFLYLHNHSFFSFSYVQHLHSETVFDSNLATLVPRFLSLAINRRRYLIDCSNPDIQQQIQLFMLEVFQKLYVPKKYCSYRDSYRRVFDGHMTLKISNWIQEKVETIPYAVNLDNRYYETNYNFRIDIKSLEPSSQKLLFLILEDENTNYHLSKWLNTHPQNLKREKQKLWQLLNKNF